MSNGHEEERVPSIVISFKPGLDHIGNRLLSLAKVGKEWIGFRDVSASQKLAIQRGIDPKEVDYLLKIAESEGQVITRRTYGKIE